MATLKYWSEASSVYILMAERYKVSSTLQDGGWLYWPCNIQIPDTEANTAHAQLRSILRLPALEAGGGGGSCTNHAVVTSYQHLLLSSSILQPQVGSGGA